MDFSDDEPVIVPTSTAASSQVQQPFYSSNYYYQQPPPFYYPPNAPLVDSPTDFYRAPPPPPPQQHQHQHHQQSHRPSFQHRMNSNSSGQTPLPQGGTDLDAPTPFFIDDPLTDSGLALIPQADTPGSSSVIPPSLVDPQGNGRIMPIVEEPDSTAPSLVASSDYNTPNSNSNNSTGMLTLLKTRKQSRSGKNNKNGQPKSKPAFVVKLWTMVNEPANKDLISWFEDGKSFVVSNREMFVQKILPKYFKHSNFASFVRQLNMYGWHKVQDPSSGSLHSDERWQFTNPNFQRDKPELLDKIVRHKPQDNQEETNGNGLNQWDVSMLINELNSLKSNQMKITQELSRVRQDNELLWQELYTSREKNLEQNDKIEKILHFLASVYGNRVQVLEDGEVQDLTQQPPHPHQQMQPYAYPDMMTPTGGHQGSRTKPILMIQQQRHASNSSNTTSHHFSEVNSPVEVARTPGSTATTTQTNPTPAALPKSNPNLDELSKTIEQQGHTLNDIITRLQQNQMEQAPTFDLDEFLNEDLLPPQDEVENVNASTAGVTVAPSGSIKNDDEEDLKRTADDDIEEIVNPSKKRKSGNF